VCDLLVVASFAVNLLQHTVEQLITWLSLHHYITLLPVIRITTIGLLIMDDSRTLSLEDLNCIRDMMLADLRADLRAALTHSLSNQSSIQHPTPTTAPERYRELEMKNKALQEQNSQLRRESKDKDDDIKSLRIENISLETEVVGLHQEIELLKRKYDELEKDYQECRAEKSAD